jgi:hypothetical protein
MIRITPAPDMESQRLQYEDPDNADPLRTLALALAVIRRGCEAPPSTWWAFKEIRRLIMTHPERTRRPRRGGARSALERTRQAGVDLFRYLEVERLRERTGLAIGEELFAAAARSLEGEELLAASWQAIRDSYFRHKRSGRVTV